MRPDVSRSPPRGKRLQGVKREWPAQMSPRLGPRFWTKRIATLRRAAASGDAASMRDLGLTWLEGIQDRYGRALVRRNPRAALRLLRDAFAHGDTRAAFSIGYAYDVGLGTKRDQQQALRWYRIAFRAGVGGSANNIATVYRDAGKLALAFRWWKRGGDLGDGDATVNVGYCYFYGIGTRKNPSLARRELRRALKSKDISESGREEALYHLAVDFVDHGKTRFAIPLLTRAAKDDDYPEAAAVLTQIQRGISVVPCRCRRDIGKNLRGHARCPQHSIRDGRAL